MTIPESIRALVATGPNGHLTTLNADGSPQVTVVWVGIDGDEFAVGHTGVWQKADVALDTHHYDQAHMNAEFRALAGITPGAFLAAMPIMSRTVSTAKYRVMAAPKQSS